MFKSKWDRWYEAQNPATQAWIDRETQKDNEIIVATAIPMFILGVVIGFILGLGF